MASHRLCRLFVPALAFATAVGASVSSAQVDTTATTRSIPDSTSASHAPVSAAADSNVLPPLTLLVLRPVGDLDAGERDALAARLRESIAADPRFRVAADSSDSAATSQCFAIECAVAAGRANSVPGVVMSQLNRIGTHQLLTLRLVDPSTSAILRDVSLDCECSFNDLLATTVPLAAERLLQRSAQNSLASQTPQASPAEHEIFGAGYPAPAPIPGPLYGMHRSLSGVMLGAWGGRPFGVLADTTNSGFGISIGYIAPDDSGAMQEGVHAELDYWFGKAAQRGMLAEYFMRIRPNPNAHIVSFFQAGIGLGRRHALKNYFDYNAFDISVSGSAGVTSGHSQLMFTVRMIGGWRYVMFGYVYHL